MTIKIESPVGINQMIYLRNGSALEYVKVTGYEGNEERQRVRLERQDKDRAVWVDVKQYNKTFSDDPRVILDRIEDGMVEVLETMKGKEAEAEDEEVTEHIEDDHNPLEAV